MSAVKRIPSLDGLRALAIATVLYKHAEDTFPVHNDTVTMFLGNSQLGVQTFFVISGYLITFLLLKELKKSNTIDLKAFYIRRSLRIFPAFYAYLAITSVLVMLGVLVAPVEKIVAAATYTWNYSHIYLNHDKPGGWYLNHYWTLALEEQFYLLWPLAVLLLREKRALKLSLAIIFLSPFIRLGTYFLWPDGRGFISMMLHTSADMLMYGCAVALLEGNPRFESFVKRLENGRLALAGFLFVAVVSPYISARFGGAYNLSLGFLLNSLCMAIVMIWVVRYPGTKVGQLLNSRGLVFIGVLSYSLYLWNPPFLNPKENTTWTGMFPVNLVIVFVIALLSYYLIEQPFLQLKDRFARATTPPAPPTPAPVAEQAAHGEIGILEAADKSAA